MGTAAQGPPVATGCTGVLLKVLERGKLGCRGSWAAQNTSGIGAGSPDCPGGGGGGGGELGIHAVSPNAPEVGCKGSKEGQCQPRSPQMGCRNTGKGAGTSNALHMNYCSPKIMM